MMELAPDEIVLAFDAPVAINEVILQGKFRLRITEELTREEFLRRDEAMRSRRGIREASVSTVYPGNKIDMDNAVITEGGPGSDFRYFYAAELV